MLYGTRKCVEEQQGCEKDIWQKRDRHHIEAIEGHLLDTVREKQAVKRYKA